MRAYFAGNAAPTPEEMGKMLAATPEQAAAARKLKNLAVGNKKPLRKKLAPAGALREVLQKKKR